MGKLTISMAISIVNCYITREYGSKFNGKFHGKIWQSFEHPKSSEQLATVQYLCYKRKHVKGVRDLNSILHYCTQVPTIYMPIFHGTHLPDIARNCRLCTAVNHQSHPNLWQLWRFLNCEGPGILVLLSLQHCFWSCTIGSTLRQTPKPVKETVATVHDGLHKSVRPEITIVGNLQEPHALGLTQS